MTTLHLQDLAKIQPVPLVLTIIVCAADFDSAVNCLFAVSHFVQLSSECLSGIKLTSRRCIILTIWHRTCVPICNVQCNAQNVKCRRNVSALMQPPFKFWSSADQYRHLIAVPKCSYYRTVQNNSDVTCISVNYNRVLDCEVIGQFVESSQPRLWKSVFNCRYGFLI